VLPLFGNLPHDAQDRAITPSPPGRRKIVLATSIAETSLTIEGVRVVIDAGLSRVPRFSPRTGMTRLATVRVTRAAADQRRGRAGRLGPGVCYRLWPEAEQQQLVPHDTPEILAADLAPLALELARAGISDPTELRWLDPPPAPPLAQARELLAELRALDDRGRITPHGGRMAELAVHPRLAHMLLEAERLGAGVVACALAALLEERDILRGGDGPCDADVELRLDVLSRPAGNAATTPGGCRVDHGAAQRVRAVASDLRRRILPAAGRGKIGADSKGEHAQAGLLLALAYPDRIAQRRPGAAPRYLLRNGSGATFAGSQRLAEAAYIVAAELDGRLPESRILLAAPLTLEELEAHFGDQIAEQSFVAWDETAEAVLARRQARLGALVLRDAPMRDADPEAVARALLAAIAARGVGALPWTAAARRTQQRVLFLRQVDPSWPDLSDDALVRSLDRWLAPHVYGIRRLDEVRRIDLDAALLAMLTPQQRRAIDRLAPTHVEVPSGSNVPIDYANADAPVLAVRLQELFGLRETPRIAGGAVPLTLHLLSPAHRPVQVTRDLEGFWRTTYFEVRKDLRGRYPKHHWPDDPLAAAPTSRTKRRG
jgi:ATP-dependent helicase HrpB